MGSYRLLRSALASDVVDRIGQQDDESMKEKKKKFDCGVIIRDNKNKPIRLIGAMQDVTTQRALQQQLISEKLLHKNEMAKGILQVAEAERKKLEKELHDNINQLLGVVRLYIEHALNNKAEQETLLKVDPSQNGY